MLRISFDIDGVLADFTENATRIINTKWPGKVPINYEPPNWYWTDILNKEDWGPIFDDIKATPDFWRRQLPYTRNVDAAKRYINTHPDTLVYFITQRPDTVNGTGYEQTLDWLVNNGLIPFDKEVPTPIVVKDPAEKQKYMEELGIQYSVDDKMETVEQCNFIKGHKSFLLDRSWNQTSSQPRVYSVDHYLDFVRLEDEVNEEKFFKVM